MGRARMVWLMGSGVGVMNAAMMKMIRKAYLKFFSIQRELMTPILERKKIRIGVSNTAPIPRSSFTIRLKYSSMVMTAWKSWPTFRKNRQA